MKLLRMLAVVLALTVLGGCGSKAREEQRLTRVRPAQLEKEGEPLLGDGTAYDFYVDGKIRSLRVEARLWDGEWKVQEEVFPIRAGKGRLLLAPAGKAFSITLRQEGDEQTKELPAGIPDRGSQWRVEDCGIVPEKALSIFMTAEPRENLDSSALEETHYHPDYLEEHPELLAEYQWIYQIRAVFSENPDISN